MRAPAPPNWWKSTLLLMAVGSTLGGAAWLSLQQTGEFKNAPSPSLREHRVFTHRVGARTRAS